MSDYLLDGLPHSTALSHDQTSQHDAPRERLPEALTTITDNAGLSDNAFEWLFDSFPSQGDTLGFEGPAFFSRVEANSLELPFSGNRTASRMAGPPTLPFDNTFSGRDLSTRNGHSAQISSHSYEPWSAWITDAPKLPGADAHEGSLSTTSDISNLEARMVPLAFSYRSQTHDAASTEKNVESIQVRQEHIIQKTDDLSYSREVIPSNSIHSRRLACVDDPSSHHESGSLRSSPSRDHEARESLNWKQDALPDQETPSVSDWFAPAAALICLKCPVGQQRTFRRPGDYRRHMKKHEAPVFKCVFSGCNKTFYRRDKLDAHIKQGHRLFLGGADQTHFQFEKSNEVEAAQEPLLFTCAICLSAFTRLVEFNRHHNRKHARRYECDRCDRSFNLKADLERHKNSVHQAARKNQFYCPSNDCSLEFARKDNLLRHIKRIHGEDNTEHLSSKVIQPALLPLATRCSFAREPLPAWDPTYLKTA